MRNLLDSDRGDAMIVSGCSPNPREPYEWFDHVVLLSAPPDVIAERLATRTNNPFGKRVGEIERSLAIQRESEPLLRAGAGIEVDTTRPLGEVVARILEVVGLEMDRRDRLGSRHRYTPRSRRDVAQLGSAHRSGR